MLAVCFTADVAVTHCHPKLPFQTYIVDRDAERLFETFRWRHARMLVNGRFQTEEVVTVLSSGRVVVNCDKRIVVLMPRDVATPEVPRVATVCPKAEDDATDDPGEGLGDEEGWAEEHEEVCGDVSEFLEDEILEEGGAELCEDTCGEPEEEFLQGDNMYWGSGGDDSELLGEGVLVEGGEGELCEDTCGGAAEEE